SYRPDGVGEFSAIREVYAAHVAELAPLVDLFLCETMSTALEARAAAEAAAASGKPVWVSWTISDTTPGQLRSGETLAEAGAALDGVPVAALLVNCASPEAVSAAMPHLARLGRPFGGFANGFSQIPEGWRLSDGISALGERRDLTPGVYARHATDWIGAGASIVGGCCAVGPAHIAAISAGL
ncbi:MAG: homocysteine S-methyltransferase family protein, partial [Pseudomonadota bacterium]